MATRFTSVRGQDASKPLPYDPSHSIPEQVRSSCATSLRNLRTQYLDSLILHGPLDTSAETLQAFQTLAELQREGTVRMIGVSNVYEVELLEMLEREIDGGGNGGEGNKTKVQAVQNRWYNGNGFDREVRKYCVEKGIMYQCVCPFDGFAEKKGWDDAVLV